MKERLLQWFNRRRKNVKFCEFMLSVMMFGWGALLISPLDTFGSSKSYASIANVALEDTWGWICLIIAAFLFHGMLHKNRILQCLGHLLATGLWSNIATAVLIANMASTSWVVYYGLAIMHMFLCVVCWLSGRDGHK